MKWKIGLLSFLVCNSFIISNSCYALPFNIFPKAGTTLPGSFPPGGAATAYYTIQNNTVSPRIGNFIKYLPPNVSQITSGGTFADTCPTFFNLAPKNMPGDSCTLQLNVAGIVNPFDPDPHHHLFACFPGGKTCAGTNFPLQVMPEALFTGVSVGFFAEGPFARPLGYFTLDGGRSWTRSLVLNPKGTFADVLNSVSCSGSGLSCVAVGLYAVDITTIAPLGYFTRDGGRTWTLASLLNPKGTLDDELNGVACDTTGLVCAAVGFFDAGATLNPLGYFTRDGGQTWALATTLNPVGTLANRLSAVACSSNGLLCTAVGGFTNGATVASLGYFSLDGGNNWFPSTTLNPISIFDSLLGVACGSSGLHCTAVGFSFNGTSTVPLSYVSLDGGNNWFLSSMLNPVGTTDDELNSVACGADGQHCTAVGFYETVTSSVPLGYYSIDGGVSWFPSIVLTPIGTIEDILNSVTCSASGLQCIAVGISDNGSAIVPIAYYSNDGGKIWAPSAPITPVGTQDNQLLGVG